MIFAKIRPRTTAARGAADTDSGDAPSAFSWLNALLLVLLVVSGGAAWRSLRAPVRPSKAPPAEVRAPGQSQPAPAEMPPPTMAALVPPPEAVQVPATGMPEEDRAKFETLAHRQPNVSIADV
ncbi:MAG TPA: hypothetical protein VNH43_13620, partial [Vicinamibacteria bacterium]|nr:hypothetical protein [Vicinamibacteria bacterium]